MRTAKGKEEKRQYLLKHYGVTNVSQIPEVKEKKRQKALDKYGVDNVSKSKEVQAKIKSTMLERHGVEYSMQSQKILNKMLKSNRGSINIKEYKLINGNIVHYQSKLELKLIKYCEKYNILIEDGDSINYMFKGKNKKYHIDFKIKKYDVWRLVEIKAKHHWWYKGLESGLQKAKIQAAVKYSRLNNYLPYKIIFSNSFTPL